MTASAYAFALSHPIRVEIIRLMKTKKFAKTSPSLLMDEFDASAPNVAYHVRILRDAGALRACGTRRVRGAIAHYYELDREALKSGRKALMDLV